MRVSSTPFDVPTALRSIAVALLVSGCVWGATWWLVAPPDAPTLPDRLVYALKWSALAVLLTFVTGIEAIAHQRFGSAAFDPLAGRESRQLLVDIRYLQNTLEQLVVFVAGLLLLAIYSDDGGALRAVVAAALVWMLARLAFWIGYQRSAAQRVGGLIGVAQSLVILLYGCARVGFEWGGPIGACVPLVLFGAAEFVLVARARRSAPADLSTDGE